MFSIEFSHSERIELAWDNLRFEGLLLFLSCLALAFYLSYGKKIAESANSEFHDIVLIPAGPFLFGSTHDDVNWTVQKFFAESKDWYRDETPGQAMYLNENLRNEDKTKKHIRSLL